MTEPVRRSPLEDREALTSAEARLAERRFAGKLILRGSHGEISAAGFATLGFALPETSPGTASADGVTALWLGPDEWMMVTEPGAETALAARLAGALGGAPHQIADVTDYYTIIGLSGPAARTILMKLTMLDMHERAFKAGEVRGTMLAHSQGLIHQLADDGAEGGPAFEIFVRWSMADYLWCLLAEGGREFGLKAQKPVTGERLVV